MFRSPDRYSVTRRRAVLMVWGVPALIAGLALAAAPFLPDVRTESGEPLPAGTLVPIGSAFALVGAVLTFGWTGIVIDRRSRTVTRWWGVIVAFVRKSAPVEGLTRVSITREHRQNYLSENRRYRTVYPVRLAGGGRAMILEEPEDRTKARRRAEEVARFLDLGMEDVSGSERVFREAGTLDEPLRERLLRKGARRELPESPPEARSKVVVSGDEATIEIPPPGYGLAFWIGLVLLAWALVGLVFMAFFGLPLLVAAAGFVYVGARSATARHLVTVSPRGLRSERRSPLGTTIREMPGNELEEVEMGDFAVMARSDRATIEIGAKLPPKERVWLKDVIEFALTS